MRPPSLSFRGAKRRGNLKQALTISPKASLCSECVPRDCHALLRKARNDKLASASLPCHGKARSAAFFDEVVKCFGQKKWGILIKKESEGLLFTDLEIPRDYYGLMEEF